MSSESAPARIGTPSTADELESAVQLIRNVVADRVELGSDLPRDVLLSDLGFKSIEFIQLVLSLESVAGCTLDESEASDSLQPFQTVGDVADLLHELKARSPA